VDRYAPGREDPEGFYGRIDRGAPTDVVAVVGRQVELKPGAAR
jgi:hypothetical protein